MLVYGRAFQQFTHGIAEPDEIDQIEAEFLESINHGGLLSWMPYKGKAYKYDFNARFSSICCSTVTIPMGKGELYTLTQEEMDEKISKGHTLIYGIYTCKVYPIKSVFQKTTPTPDFLFEFNKNNRYTHFELELAMKLGLKIDVIDEPNNAYRYPSKTCRMLPLKTIFGDYMNYFYELKKQGMPYAKDFLNVVIGATAQKVKIHHVLKSGQTNLIDGINPVVVSCMPAPNGSISVRFQDKSNLYLYRWARIQPFVSSIARAKMGSFLLYEDRYKDCRRVCTDGFIMTKPLVTDTEFVNNVMGRLKFEGSCEEVEIEGMNNITGDWE